MAQDGLPTWRADARRLKKTTFMKQTEQNSRVQTTTTSILAGLLSLAVSQAMAQTYTVVDLTPTAGNAVGTDGDGSMATA